MTSFKIRFAAIVIAAVLAGSWVEVSAKGGAKVVGVRGKVEVSVSGAWRDARAGEMLVEGAKVRTGAGAEAYLAWPDGHNVKVSALSVVTVSAVSGGGKGGELKLSSGKVFAASDKPKGGTSFNVKTPSAVAGVRGTKFSVGAKGAGATLVSVKGSVEVMAPGAGLWVAAKNNMTVAAGSTIKTGPGGSCVAAWGKGNAVQVNPLTRMTLAELGGGAGADSSLDVASGKVSIRAKKGSGGSAFSVRTPTAVAGVRGTKFSVEAKAGAGATLVSVRGSVEVREPGEPVWVAARENMKVSAGAAVKTGPGGSCAVAWAKGNVVKVNPLTRVTLEQLGGASSGSSKLLVEDGKISVKAKKVVGGSTFSVRTPTAVAGVRGTKFSVETKSAGAGAALVSVKGDVSVQAPGSGGWAVVKKNMKVSAGSTVKTGAGGSVVVAWAKGNVMKVEPLTRVTLERLSSALDDGGANLLKLDRGTVAVRAKKVGGAGASFEVRTPTAVAGVRGTKFSVSVTGDEEKPDTSVMCAEGEVALVSGGVEASLTEGLKSSARGDAPSPAAQMSRSEMESINSVSELDDPAVLEISGAAYSSEVMVAEGKVEVKSEGGEAVELGEGMKSSVGEGAAPSAPAGMSGSEMQELKSDPDLNSAALLEMGDAGGGPSSNIMVAEGSVSVTSDSGDSVDVGAGMKTSVGEGSSPAAPGAMSDAEKQELDSASEVDDPAVLEIGGGKSSTEVMVAEGSVALTSESGDSVDLGAGMKASVEEGGAPEAPSPMTTSELESVEAGASGLEDMGVDSVGPQGEGGAGGGSPDSAAAADTIGGSIDSILDSNVINDTVDSVLNNEDTFDMDVNIYFGQ